MGVDAPIAVAVVDDHDDRQGRPELLRIETPVVGGQVAHPADRVVVVPAGGEHEPVVRRDDPVAAHGREVDAVVERLAIDQP